MKNKVYLRGKKKANKQRRDRRAIAYGVLFIWLALAATIDNKPALAAAILVFFLVSVCEFFNDRISNG